MVNKDRLYWTLQAGGWAFYAGVQILFSVFASNGQGVSSQRVIFLFAEALLCLLLSHIYRYVINQRKWLTLGMANLIPRVILGVFFLGFVMCFLRLPFAISLGISSLDRALDLQTILVSSFFYTIIFSFWSALYFIYNYFERYNTSLKLEASAKEIELSNLKAQLNPHFIFNCLNAINRFILGHETEAASDGTLSCHIAFHRHVSVFPSAYCLDIGSRGGNHPDAALRHYFRPRA